MPIMPRIRTARPVLVVTLLGLAAAWPGVAAPSKSAVVPGRPSVPVIGKEAPAFTLPDTGGRPHTLASFRGHPTVLFFFCGCPRCHAVAQAWEDAQGDLGTSGPPPRTAVIFSDGPDAARAFATQTGLQADQVTLLTDPQERVTDRYRVRPCPRVFVLDAAGRIRDTNPDPNAPALEIVSRALTTLRRLPAPPAAPPTGPSRR